MSHQSQHDSNLTEFFREFYHLSRKTKNLDDFLEKSKEQLGSVLETLIQCTVSDKVEKMVESGTIRVTVPSTDEKIKALKASSVNKDERITNLEVTLNESRDKYLTNIDRQKSLSEPIVTIRKIIYP